MGRTCNIAESLVFMDSGDAIFSVKDGIRAGYRHLEGTGSLIFSLVLVKAPDLCKKKLNYSAALRSQCSFLHYFTLFSTLSGVTRGGETLPPSGARWDS